ncbi:hypothetical protein TNCV_2947261 [Trichonephila clavipes]|nr:hypothetical protein TNCV_2947261 [Trichonephila clavipes]
MLGCFSWFGLDPLVPVVGNRCTRTFWTMQLYHGNHSNEVHLKDPSTLAQPWCDEMGVQKLNRPFSGLLSKSQRTPFE